MTKDEKILFDDIYNKLCLSLHSTKYIFTSSALIKDNKIVRVIMNYSKEYDDEYMNKVTERADEFEADSIIMVGEQELLKIKLPEDDVLLEKINSCEIPVSTIPGKENYIFGIFIKDKFEYVSSKVSLIKKDIIGKRYTDNEQTMDYFILDKPIILEKGDSKFDH